MSMAGAIAASYLFLLNTKSGQGAAAIGGKHGRVEIIANDKGKTKSERVVGVASRMQRWRRAAWMRLHKLCNCKSSSPRMVQDGKTNKSKDDKHKKKKVNAKKACKNFAYKMRDY